MKYITHEDFHNGYRYLWFMTDHGEGHCNIYHYEGTDYGVLSNLSVEENHRKRGIGTALQVERERVLKEYSGLKDAWLWVDKGSWMQSWYERRGYIYDSENKDEEGTIWMKKELK